jgi:hypothetical protein
MAAIAGSSEPIGAAEAPAFSIGQASLLLLGVAALLLGLAVVCCSRELRRLLR